MLTSAAWWVKNCIWSQPLKNRGMMQRVKAIVIWAAPNKDTQLHMECIKWYWLRLSPLNEFNVICTNRYIGPTDNSRSVPSQGTTLEKMFYGPRSFSYEIASNRPPPIGPLFLAAIGWASIGTKVWILICIKIKQSDVSTHQCCDFSGGLVKPPLNLGHG